MQKKREVVKKVVASLIAFMLVFTNFATLGNALVVYAAEVDNREAINFSAQFVMVENSEQVEENTAEGMESDSREEAEFESKADNTSEVSSSVGSIVDSYSAYMADSDETTDGEENLEEEENSEAGKLEEGEAVEEPLSTYEETAEEESVTEMPVEEAKVEPVTEETSKEQVLENGLALEITVGVNDSGYLKNSKIDIKDLANQMFTLKDNIFLGEFIQEIEDGKIKLKQINAGTEIKVYIPIELKSEEYVNVSKLQEGVEVVLTTTYVDNEGSEEILKKSVKPVLGIENNVNLVVESDIEKFIPYTKEGVNEALVQIRVTVGTDTANELPIKDTTTRVSIPEIEGAEIKDLTVAAISTGYTNGLGNGEVVFTGENWSYEGNVVSIMVNNAQKDGSYKKNAGKDEYIISYKYSNVGDISGEKIGSTVEVKSNVFTSEGTKEVSNQIEKEYDLSQANSNIITYELTRKTEEISKGYLYANANSEVEAEYELEYDNAIDVNISRVDLVRRIEIRESDEYFSDAEGNRYSLEGNVYYKTVRVNKENLISIIGDTGSLELLLEDGTSIISINKDTEDEGDGYITISFGENRIGKILIRINNPASEGILNIVSTKAIEKATYEKIDLSLFSSMNSEYVAAAELEEGIVTEMGTKEVSTELRNTITDATVSLSRNDLSTLMENEDVEIEICLNNAKETSDMYKKPVFELTLPSEIEDIEIKDINLLYGNDELEIGNVETLKNEAGNIVIKITLGGVQTKYALGASESGTTIILKTDMKVNMYTASRNARLEMNYYNEDATNYGLGSDWKMLSEPSNYMLMGRHGTYDTELNIVAPEGLVNAQMISNYRDGLSIVSINQGRKEDTIGTFKDARIAEMKILVINNSDETMNEVSILGRTIFDGNKKITADELLGTNMDAPMVSEINSQSGKATRIYYSENGEATKDLEDTDNGWSEEVSDWSKVKSFLIMVEEEVKVGDILTYSYDFNIPENLTNNVDLAGTFATYYTDSTAERVVEADSVVLTTGDAPILSAEMTYDVKGSAVLEGQYINYVVTIKNEGRTSATNVVFKVDIPEGTVYVKEGNLDENVTDLAIEVGEIKAYQTETIEFQLAVKEGFEGDISLEGIVEADGLEEPILISQAEKFKVDDSQIELKVSTSRGKQPLLPNQNMTYNIQISNKENENINNLVVTQIVPEGVDFVDAYIAVENSSALKGTYDESTRTVTWNIDTLEDTKLLKLVVKGQELTEYERTLVSSVMVEGEYLRAVYTSGEVYTTLARPELEINSYSTSDNRYIKEGDYVEYVLEVKNIGKAAADTIEISNQIPEGLVMISGSCELSNGKVINGFVSKNYSVDINLFENESAKITLKCLARDLPSSSETIANTSWKISGNNVETVETAKVQNILQPKVMTSSASDLETGAFKIESDTLNSTQTVSAVTNIEAYVNVSANAASLTENEATYRIIGKAFNDANKNGQRDENEEGMANIVAKLCDASSQDIVAQVVTNDVGEYVFSNIEPGDYYVKFEYDSSKYQVTDYKKDGVNADRNSDAIVSNYKAVTDKISIVDSSVSDIDVGFYRAGIFDLSLDVNINRLTVQNEEGTTTYDMENSKLAKVDIDPKYSDSSKVFVEYTIEVSNKGEIAGYVKSLMSYLPSELELDTSLNANWYIGTDGNAHTRELADTLIQPGETKTVTLVLTKQMTEDGTGLINNIFEIESTFNEYAISDIDSTEANNADGEDDMSSVDVIIGIKTGGSMISLMIITATLITLIVVLYVIKLHADNKSKGVIV